MNSSLEYKKNNNKLNWNINIDFWKSNKYLNHIKKKFIFTKKQTNINLLFAFLNVFTSINKKKKINVLDFGGGTGLNYNKNFLISNLNHQIYIYDNKELINIGLNINKNKSVFFISKLQEIKNKIDIIFVSSVFQYINNISLIVSNLANLNSKLIVFEDLFAHESEEFILKENFLNTDLVFKIHNLEKVIKIMKKNGYSLMFKSPYIPYLKNEYKFFSIKNLPKKYYINHTYCLVFLKN